MILEDRLSSGTPEAQTIEGRYPVLTQVRATPRIYVLDGFISHENREQILDVTSDPEDWERRGAVLKTDGTGTSFELPADATPAVTSLALRTYELLGTRNEVGATLRYRRYERGQSHPPHTDTFTIGGHWLVATAMATICGPEGGGETEFPFASGPVRVPSVPGRLTVWLNHMPNGLEEPRSSHSALAVVGGEKITVTNFVYSSPTCDLVRYGIRSSVRP